MAQTEVNRERKSACTYRLHVFILVNELHLQAFRTSWNIGVPHVTTHLAPEAFPIVLSLARAPHCPSKPSAGFNQVALLLSNQCFEESIGYNSSDAGAWSL